MLQVKTNFNAAVNVPEDLSGNDGAALMHVDEGDFEDWELADDDDPPHDEDDDDLVGSVDLNFLQNDLEELHGQRRRCCGHRRRRCGRCTKGRRRGGKEEPGRRRRQCDNMSQATCRGWDKCDEQKVHCCNIDCNTGLDDRGVEGSTENPKCRNCQ